MSANSGDRPHMGAGGFGRNHAHQDIEIVDLSEQILHLPETIVPSSHARWQQAFDGVAEALDGDTQRVPRLGLLSADRSSMRFRSS
jgi:hypothetical protein